MAEDQEVVMPSGDRLIYKDSSHGYWLARLDAAKLERVVSVSTVLGVLNKPALLQWVKEVTERGEDFNAVREAAGARGSSVHDAADELAAGVVPNVGNFPEDHHGYVRALANWWEFRNPKIIAHEVMVCHPHFSYAGRFDLLAEVAGELWLIDYKTSKGVYDEAHLQLAGYEGAFPFMDLPPPRRKIVVHLTARGSFGEVQTHATHDQFLEVLVAYRTVAALRKTIRKAEKDIPTLYLPEAA